VIQSGVSEAKDVAIMEIPLRNQGIERLETKKDWISLLARRVKYNPSVRVMSR